MKAGLEMKIMKSIFFILLAIPFYASAIATGTCGTTTGGAGSGILTSNIVLSPLAPIGSIIGTEFTSATYTNSNPGATLQPSSTNKPPYYVIFTITKPIVSGVTYNGATVYSTNTSGVGFAMWGDTYTSGPKFLLSNTTTAGTYSAVIHYAYIKTGNIDSITAAGLSVHPFSTRSLQCLNGSGAVITSPVEDATGTGVLLIGSVTIPACAVTSTNISVPMGDVKRTTFTGIGSTSTAQGFSIPLSCSKSAKVSISVAPGASGAFNASTGIINVDPATSGVKSTGIGIQLLYNNAALPLNVATSVGSATAGTFNVPLSARYYQTSNTVTAGSANGTATFVMTYN
ncbi:fimbrial protein [Enterobacter sp. 186315]